MPRGYWTTSSDGITFAAGSFRYQSQINYWDASNAKKYVIVAITIRNDRPRGASSVLYNSFNFTLIDLEGRSYSHATATFNVRLSEQYRCVSRHACRWCNCIRNSTEHCTSPDNLRVQSFFTAYHSRFTHIPDHTIIHIMPAAVLAHPQAKVNLN
ncbi:MAG: hypothetical protein RI985_18 [Chloroflexota bacterium]|jgi:hypothetical protein